MKKLSFVLALILACGVLAACGDEGATTTASKQNSNAQQSGTPAKTTQTPSKTSTPAKTSKPTTTQEQEPVEQPKDELIDGSKFTVDGDLADWEGLATMKVQGEASTAGKSATFYGAMTTTGLYLACDAYHDVYTTGKSNWFENSNFEMFIDGEQVYVYATGMDTDCATGAGDNVTCQITTAVMKTTEIGDTAQYHTVTEVFISNENLPEDVIYLNTISVGVAWKTVSDLIIGGQAAVNADGSDEYWVVKGDDLAANSSYWPTKSPMVATPKGLYFFEQYFEE